MKAVEPTGCGLKETCTGVRVDIGFGAIPCAPAPNRVGPGAKADDVGARPYWNNTYHVDSLITSPSLAAIHFPEIRPLHI